MIHLPKLPEEKFKVEFLGVCKDSPQPDEDYPFAASPVFAAPVVEAKKLSRGADVKDVYSLTMVQPESVSYEFMPGDTIGVIPTNSDETLDTLFRQLQITHLIHEPCKVTCTNTKGPKPRFLQGTTTLYHMFKEDLDVCSVPKKLLIRVLHEYTADEEQRKYLGELCGKEGGEKYTSEVLERRCTVLELMLRCPSCRPPVARLVDHLPKLLPRPYSLASSPLHPARHLTVVFSVVRGGLCSGALQRVAEDCIKRGAQAEHEVKVFFRKSANFTLPGDADVPIILVGPGTGLAPFMGFLAHRRVTREPGEPRGSVVLLTGCRYRGRDQLFAEELEGLRADGTLTRHWQAFSRDTRDTTHTAKYVQEHIVREAQPLGDLMFRHNAIIYVCGDARNMSRAVAAAFGQVVTQYRGVTDLEAAEVIKTLKSEGRYREDIWC